MWQEFKTFVARGNVLDLAIGIVLGAAFGTVVSSFVSDVLMPPIGMLAGRIDFTELYVNLSGTEYESLAAATQAGAPTINYGVFLNNVLSFFIVAFSVFLVVRAYNRMMVSQQETAPPPSEKTCPRCGMAVPVAATRCGHCTSEIGA